MPGGRLSSGPPPLGGLAVRMLVVGRLDVLRLVWCQRSAATGRRQVSEQAGQLGAVFRPQRDVHPVQEGLLAQAALDEAVPELADRLIALGVGCPHTAIFGGEPVT